MLPKNLIARIPIKDLNGRGFEGMLSWTVVHAIVGTEKTTE
jgi:hypothetical protein